MSNFIKWSILIGIAITVQCCDNSSSECQSNVDCGIGSACVESKCVFKKSDCEVFGAFTEVAEIAPRNADEIDKIHVVIDKDFSVHYCYHGFDNGKRVSFYGRQIDSSDFREESLSLIEDKDVWVECGGIAVSRKGTPVLFSKNTGGIVLKKNKSWTHVELPGLTSAEAKGAIYSDQTVVSFSKAHDGGVFLNLSLGYGVNFQPIYIAKINEDSSVVSIVNGWEDSGDSDIRGFAPVLASTEKENVIVVNDKRTLQTVLTDENLNIKEVIEGNYPDVFVLGNSSFQIALLDHNSNIQIYNYGNDGLFPIGTFGTMEFYRGQLPWRIAVDSAKRTHILYEDKNTGVNSLAYRVLSKTGNPGQLEVISNEIFGSASGTQRYSLVTDLCKRPYIALVEGNRKDTKIKVLEQI